MAANIGHKCPKSLPWRRLYQARRDVPVSSGLSWGKKVISFFGKFCGALPDKRNVRHESHNLDVTGIGLRLDRTVGRT